MDTTIIMYFGTLGFLILIVAILIFVNNQKIEVIGDFIKKITPTIPLTGILRIFKK